MTVKPPNFSTLTPITIGNTATDTGLTSTINPPYPVGRQIRNLFIGLVAILLMVILFIGQHTQSTGVSLSIQAKQSIPLDEALINGKPTLMEFYADWCTSCQAMAPDLANLKQEYGERINFVMLNVDNTKWLPEILDYQVDGIPHFVFLNQEGFPVASAVGKQPKSILVANLEAFLMGDPLPYAAATIGKVSNFHPPINSNRSDDPKAHGRQG